MQATNRPTEAAAITPTTAPIIERLDLLTSSAATGDAGNSWGGHKTRIVSTSKGDTYTVFQAPGSGYTAHQWVLMHYSRTGRYWSQAAAGDAGREPANLLRGPDDTIYVIAWPGGMPAMWTSADGFASQQNIPGSWLQNDWPYAGAGIDTAGNVYLLQSNSNDLKPGHISYSVRAASTGQWSPVETTSTDYRSTYAFVLPGDGLTFLASADVQWSTMSWSAPNNATNSRYVWPQTSYFHAGSANQAASEVTIHAEAQTSQHPNVNVYTQDAYTDNQGRVHVLYQDLGPSTQDQFTVRHAVVQNGQVVKDVRLKMYDVADARITQDSTGQFYFITGDNTCVCLLVYPADSLDGTTLQGSYAALPLNGYHPKDWLFLASPRTGSPLSDEIDFAFPGDHAQQWIAGRLRLRSADSATTPSVLPATTAGTPAAPTTLSGGFNDGGMSLSWTASASAASYNLYRGYTHGNETLYKSGLNATSFVDTNLEPGADYWYRVTAVNSAGESAASAEIITYTPGAPTTAVPAAPSNLQGAFSGGANNMSWTASSTPNVNYDLYRGWLPGAESLYKSGISGTSYSDSQNLELGKDYWYKVTAVSSAGGQSPASNEVITYVR